MQIIHPQTAPGSYPPAEDVFVAVDDMRTELGRGHIICLYQPHMYPDCPVNLYFTMTCQESARYLLFGALMARARQLRDMYPNLRARVYTNINPSDGFSRGFYAEGGFDLDDAETMLRMPIPAGDGVIPMSCAVARTPLNTPEEIGIFLSRLQANDITYINQDYLTALMRQPHFLPLGLYRNRELVAEILMTGVGDTADITAVYTTQAARRQGFARALTHRAMAVMAAEGATSITTTIMNRSEPQRRLMADFRAEPVGVRSVYPGLYL